MLTEKTQKNSYEGFTMQEFFRIAIFKRFYALMRKEEMMEVEKKISSVSKEVRYRIPEDEKSLVRLDEEIKKWVSNGKRWDYQIEKESV